MASELPTQLAREAKDAISRLKQDHEFLQKRFEDLDLLEVRERVARIEERLSRIEKIQEEHKELPVLADRINKLEKNKEEADRRYWQFVVLFIGGILTLAINLVVSFIRK